MSTIIFCGADVHDNSILGRFALGKEEPVQRTWKNTTAERKAMIRDLKSIAKQAGATRVVFGYEASGLGFGLYDDLKEQGIDCYVLAPTKIHRSPKESKIKTDDKDARRILEELRNHFLAGSRLPAVWIPDMETRDDRELVRRRLEVGSEITRVKARIQALLKRNRISKPKEAGKSWTVKFRRWLSMLPDGEDGIGFGAYQNLASLLRHLDFLEEEEERLGDQVSVLAKTDRYQKPVVALQGLKGVGLLTAMVFLTEMGDLERFRNRRTVGAYFGLVPSAHESGEQSDRKGHITHQGSPRVRRILCQACWARIRTDRMENIAYKRIVARNPKHKKIAVVAMMRRLAVLMWHIGKCA